MPESINTNIQCQFFQHKYAQTNFKGYFMVKKVSKSLFFTFDIQIYRLRFGMANSIIIKKYIFLIELERQMLYIYS